MHKEEAAQGSKKKGRIKKKVRMDRGCNEEGTDATPRHAHTRNEKKPRGDIRGDNEGIC